MRNPLRSLGLRFTTGHALWIAALAAPCIALTGRAGHGWLGIVLVVLGALVAVVTVRGRRVTGWIATVFAWLLRRRKPPALPSEPVVGATAMPGDHVAVRWQGEILVAAIELIPRPFTPTVVVGGRAQTDDVVDTRLVEELLSVHCPDLDADIISAGYRVGSTASTNVVKLYDQVIGRNPAPAHRRTWITLRADPERIRKSAQRREDGVAGLVRYLVASTTRIADQLAGHGVDALCERSFDEFDRATGISFDREKWSMLNGRGTFTVAYTAPGGPDVWWSARADHTITRIRVTPGAAPQSTVFLTTLAKPQTPQGFTRLSGGQRPAVQGQVLESDSHWQVPIGSAGVLVGETAKRYPVYLPFDDVDVSLELSDAQAFTQFAVRAAAAGGIVTVGTRFPEFAALIGAQTGPATTVVWPNSATTYFTPRPDADPVALRQNMIGTPRHPELPIKRICPHEETRYQAALAPPGSRPRLPPPPAVAVDPAPEVRRNGMGTAALVVAILGLVGSVSVALGIVLGVAAVILGLIARSRVRRGKATNGRIALAAIVLGVVSIIVAAVVAMLLWTNGGREFLDCRSSADSRPATCTERFRERLADRAGVTLNANASTPLQQSIPATIMSVPSVTAPSVEENGFTCRRRCT